jgi:hypothetical protein
LNNSITDCSYSDVIVTSKEVKEAISKLKLRKNDGFLGLSSDHFVHAGDDLAVHIALLISSCILHGNVPDELCLTAVTPTPKGNNADLSELNNYRGISLSSIICKIFDLVN